MTMTKQDEGKIIEGKRKLINNFSLKDRFSYFKIKVNKEGSDYNSPDNPNCVSYNVIMSINGMESIAYGSSHTHDVWDEDLLTLTEEELINKISEWILESVDSLETTLSMYDTDNSLISKLNSKILDDVIYYIENSELLHSEIGSYESFIHKSRDFEETKLKFKYWIFKEEFFSNIRDLGNKDFEKFYFAPMKNGISKEELICETIPKLSELFGSSLIDFTLGHSINPDVDNSLINAHLILFAKIVNGEYILTEIEAKKIIDNWIEKQKYPDGDEFSFDQFSTDLEYETCFLGLKFFYEVVSKIIKPFN